MSMKYQYFLLKAYSSGILQGCHMKKENFLFISYQTL